MLKERKLYKSDITMPRTGKFLRLNKFSIFIIAGSQSSADKKAKQWADEALKKNTFIDKVSFTKPKPHGWVYF